jgi:hypothetical protein
MTCHTRRAFDFVADLLLGNPSGLVGVGERYGAFGSLVLNELQHATPNRGDRLWQRGCAERGDVSVAGPTSAAICSWAERGPNEHGDRGMETLPSTAVACGCR